MTSLPAHRPMDRRAAGVGLALLAIAAIVLWDASTQTVTANYGIGPTAMPYVVATFLAIVAIGHFFVAFKEGLPEAEAADGIAIGWITVGLVALLLCIAFGGGFILATTVLFTTTARAFGRRALLVDAAIGFALGVGIHLLFTKLLTLSLPAGPIERLF